MTSAQADERQGHGASWSGPLHKGRCVKSVPDGEAYGILTRFGSPGALK